jgi:Spy/CpxP family protein refolding chaperone
MLKKTVLASTLLAVLVSFSCLAAAQEMGRPPEPPDGGGQRGSTQNRPMFDRSRMNEWMLSRATSQMTLTANEAKVIVPKIKKIMDLRFSSMEELRPYQEKLQTSLEAKPVNDKAVKQNLDLLISKAKEIKKKTEAAEEDLKAVLSVRQEAQLVMSGIITEGVSGMGMMGGMGRGMGNRGPGSGMGNRSQDSSNRPQMPRNQ